MAAGARAPPCDNRAVVVEQTELLGLRVAEGDGAPPSRAVEVAIDAAGGGGARTYTYLVPDALADLTLGEAVLVEFGRRQALAVVLAEAEAPDGIALKPIAARVRSDGPLLPPLSLELARRVASHYLAPPAIVIRAMLPPRLLERLDLVAERRPGTPDAPADLRPADADLLDQLERGPRPVRDLVAPDGRAGLIRRLRALEADGHVTLDWTLSVAGGGPRYERWIALTDAGVEAAARLAAGETVAGQRLGARQVALLAALAGTGAAGAADAAEVASTSPRRTTPTPAAPLAEQHGHGALASLARRGMIEVEIRERPRMPLAGRPVGLVGTRPPGAALSGPQAEAVALATAAIEAGDATPLLLDGVTGGGKTAIYADAIAASLERGRPALVLVPEIALATPLVDRLRADLGARVALVHSGLGEGQRADEWRRIRAGAVDIVVGTRLAVLAPLADVGVVIIDEEHEGTYKSDRTPRLQARDVALQLARIAGAAAILGSATPAVDSVGRARSGEYRRVGLPSRPTGTRPAVEVVDLRQELKDGNRGLLSARLVDALGTLVGAVGIDASGRDGDAADQAILIINRRGTASVVLCRDCGHVQACPECERPLVYHQAGGSLRCHHCGRATPLADRCPNCSSPRIRYLGGGTERVEREVRDRFPTLRVARLDRDVVERRGAAERILDAFAARRIDVLVGTSLVAKGLDVPTVTLVGVVSADVALNLPDERAAERTYQLLAQAAGRAGRGERPGLAIIQSYQPDHAAIRAVSDDNAASFYDAELDLRRRFGSPPFGRLVKLTVGITDRDTAEREAGAMARRLRERAAERGTGIAVIGPAPAYIARRADRWRWNVVLRGADPVALLDGGLDAPWSVDVDPESLL